MTPPTRSRSLFGPLVWWELVKLARRGHAARARVLFIYALLLAAIGVVFWWAFPLSPASLFRGTAPPLSPAQAAAFAQSLALVLLETQLVLVAVFTPAYAASSLSEEKDRQTLPLLLSTELTDREIVWGKAAGRAIFVLAAVLAGAPILMLTLFLGGVDGQFLAAGYALTAGTTILSAAIGISAACHSPDTRTALIRAYGQSAILVGGVLLPPFVLLSPFAMLIYSRMDFAFEPAVVRFACGFAYPVAQIFVAWLLVSEATRRLRDASPTAGPIERTEYPEPPRGRPSPILFGIAPAMPRELPPVDDADPVLWKERHTGRSQPLPALDAPLRWIGALFALIAIMLFITGGWLLVKRALLALDPVQAERLSKRGAGPPDDGGALMTAAGAFAAGLYLISLAVGLAGSVAGERHRGTLDPLRATLLGHCSVLRSKVRAHAENGLAFGIGAIAAVGCGLGADGGARLGLAAMAALAASFAFVIALATWLSVRSATPARAFLLSLLPVVLVIPMPLVVRHWIEWDALGPPFHFFVWIAAGCAISAAILWWRAETRFDKGE